MTMYSPFPLHPFLLALCLLDTVLAAPAGFQHGVRAIFTSHGVMTEIHAPFPYLRPKAHLLDVGATACSVDERYCFPFDATDLDGYSWSNFSATFVSRMYVGSAAEYKLLLEYSEDACVSIDVGSVQVFDACGSPHDRRVDHYLNQMMKQSSDAPSSTGKENLVDISTATSFIDNEYLYSALTAEETRESMAKRIAGQTIILPLSNISIDEEGYVSINVSYTYSSTDDTQTTPHLTVRTASIDSISAVQFAFTSVAALLQGSTDTFIVETDIGNGIDINDVAVMRSVGANGVTTTSDAFLCFEPHVLCQQRSNGTWIISGLLLSDTTGFPSNEFHTLENMMQLRILSMNYSSMLQGVSFGSPFPNLDTLYIRGFLATAVPSGTLFSSLKKLHIDFGDQTVPTNGSCFPSLDVFAALEQASIVAAQVSRHDCTGFTLQYGQSLVSLSLTNSFFQFLPEFVASGASSLVSLDVRGTTFYEFDPVSRSAAPFPTSLSTFRVVGLQLQLLSDFNFTILETNETVVVSHVTMSGPSSITIRFLFSESVRHIIFDHCEFPDYPNIPTHGVTTITLRYSWASHHSSEAWMFPTSLTTLTYIGPAYKIFFNDASLAVDSSLKELNLFIEGDSHFLFSMDSITIPDTLRTLRITQSDANNEQVKITSFSADALFSSSSSLVVLHLVGVNLIRVDFGIGNRLDIVASASLQELRLEHVELKSFDIRGGSNIEVAVLDSVHLGNPLFDFIAPWPPLIRQLTLTDTVTAIYPFPTTPLPPHVEVLRLTHSGAEIPKSVHTLYTNVYVSSFTSFEQLAPGETSNLTHVVFERPSVIQEGYDMSTIEVPDGVEIFEVDAFHVESFLLGTQLTTVRNLTLLLHFTDTIAGSGPGSDDTRANFAALFGPALQHCTLEVVSVDADASTEMEFGDLFPINNAAQLETLRLNNMRLPFFKPSDSFLLPKNLTRFTLSSTSYPVDSFPFVFDDEDGYTGPLSIVFHNVSEYVPEFQSVVFPKGAHDTLRLPASTTDIVAASPIAAAMNFSRITALGRLYIALFDHWDVRELPQTRELEILCVPENSDNVVLDQIGMRGIFEASYFETLLSIIGLETLTLNRCSIRDSENAGTTTLGIPDTVQNLTLSDVNMEPHLDLSQTDIEFLFLDHVSSDNSNRTITLGLGLEFLTARHTTVNLTLEACDNIKVIDIRGSNVTSTPFDQLYLPVTLAVFAHTAIDTAGATAFIDPLRGRITNRFAYNHTELRFVDLTGNRMRPFSLATGTDAAALGQHVIVPSSMALLLDRPGFIRLNLSHNDMHGYAFSFASSKVTLTGDNTLWCADDVIEVEDRVQYCHCTNMTEAGTTLCKETSCGSTCYLSKILKATPDFFLAADSEALLFQMDVYFNASACFTVETTSVGTLGPAAFTSCSTIEDPIVRFNLTAANLTEAAQDLAGYGSYMEALANGFESDTLQFNIYGNDSSLADASAVSIPFLNGCPLGNRYTASPLTCTLCEAGRVSASHTQTICTACPIGAFQNASGQSSCLQCAAGTYSHEEGRTTCLETEPGTFQSEPGQALFTPCPTGTYQDKPRSTDCKACDAGSFSNATGLSVCHICPLGSFQGDIGQIACTVCPAGRAANTTAATSCFHCEPGRVASSPGAHDCQTCPGGRYTTSVTGQALVCNLCESGRYSTVEGATSVDTCQPCPKGTYSETAGLDAVIHCEPCPRGTFGVVEAANQVALCTDCSTGRYADNTGQQTCTFCPAGRFGNRTASERVDDCTRCSPGKYNSFSGLTQCVDCPSGTYNPSFGGNVSSSCSPCPEGTACVAGSSAWSVLAGYFRDTDNSSRILACFPREACASTASAAATTCSPGYTGHLCGSCVDYEYFRLGQGCSKCGSQAIKWVLLVLLTLSACVILYFVLEARGDRMVKYGIRSVITSVQILTVYPKISQDWDPRMHSMFNVFSISNMNIELFSLACSFPLDYFTKWRMVQLFPVYLAVIMVVIYTVASKIKRRPVSFLRVSGSLIYLLVTVYTYLIANALEPYNCAEQSDGTFTMVFNPGQECFVGKWNDNRVFFAMAAVVYCGIIPLALLIAFYRYRSYKARETESFSELFGILSIPFKDDYYYWEFMFTMEKVLIVATADMLSAQLNSQGIKVFVIISAIFVFHLLNVVLKPYKVDARNNTEAIWALVRLFILISSFIYASDDITSGEKDIFTTILLAILSISFTYTFGSFVLFCRSRTNSSRRTLYRNLKLCIDHIFDCTPSHFRRAVNYDLRSKDEVILHKWVSAHMETSRIKAPKNIAVVSTADMTGEQTCTPRPHSINTQDEAVSGTRTAWRIYISDAGIPYCYNDTTGAISWELPTCVSVDGSDSE